MRVLYLTDSLSDLDGVGRYAIRLISALEEVEPELRADVLLARKHRPTSAEVPARWNARVARPPDYFYYMTPGRFWASFAQSGAKIVAAARKADVVHCIKDYPHNYVGRWAARIAGKPCIATAHGTYTVQPLLSERHGARARKTYASMDAVISVSEYTRKRMLEAMPGFSGERVHVLPNCVDASNYVEPRALPDVAWSQHPFTLSIGETKERKGHHLLLEAWCRVAPRFPEWHHYLVGRLSGDDYEAQLRGIVAQAGLEDRVHFLGNVSEQEKIDLLQRAEVFTHTSVTAADGGFEGFGIVYLEASASGTACLGTLDNGAEDAIVHDKTGLLVPQTIDAVEAALVRLLGDPELRERYGAAGRVHAGANTWIPNAERVLELYREALR